MSQTLAIVVSDEAYRAIRHEARTVGTTTEQVAASSLEQLFRQRVDLRTPEEKAAARLRFEQHLGEIRSGRPTGADNESIDAELAREYADNHEDD